MARYSVTKERFYEVSVGVIFRPDDVRPQIIPSDRTIKWMKRIADDEDPGSEDAQMRRDRFFRELLKANEETRDQSEDLVYETAKFRHWSWAEQETIRDRCTVSTPAGREVSNVLWRKELLRYLLIDWSVEVERDGQVVPISFQPSEFGTKKLSDDYYNLITSIPALAPVIDGLIMELNCLLSRFEEDESKN